jgi:hypothetical protein
VGQKSLTVRAMVAEAIAIETTRIESSPTARYKMTNLASTTQTIHQPRSKVWAWLISAGVALGSTSGMALLVPPSYLVFPRPME